MEPDDNFGKTPTNHDPLHFASMPQHEDPKQHNQTIVILANSVYFPERVREDIYAVVPQHEDPKHCNQSIVILANSVYFPDIGYLRILYMAAFN